MYDPRNVLSWLEDKVEGMLRSQMKTLAAVASGAMQMQGSGVLALGRAMQGPAKAKNRIKRVDRFLGNEKVNLDAVSEALDALARFCGDTIRPIVIADRADWARRRGPPRSREWALARTDQGSAAALAGTRSAECLKRVPLILVYKCNILHIN